MNKYYFILPGFIQDLLVSLKGYMLKKERLKKGFFDKLNAYIQGDFKSLESVEKEIELKLKNTLHNAYSFSNFYREIIKNNEIDISSNYIFSELKKMPILQKEEIRNQHLSYDKELNKRIHKISTSGSTGAGLQFYQTTEALNDQWAVWWRYRKWHGLDLNTWCGLFSGKQIVSSDEKKVFWRTNYPGKQIIFSSYHINKDSAKSYMRKIRESKLTWLHGYPSVLAQLSQFVISENLEVGIDIKLITIGSESLLPHQKEVIEKAFKVPVRQHYGLAEGVANISECEYGKLHIDEDFSYVELIPTNIPDTYRLIGTNLTNTAFPFIRYDTNDIVSGLSVGCKCGRQSRVVESIDGRVEDYIHLPNGTKVGRLPGVFIKYNQINEAQIEQYSKDSITVNIVKNKLYTMETELSLEKDLKKLLTNEMKIEFVYLDSIPKTKNGKLRFVISHMK